MMDMKSAQRNLILSNGIIVILKQTFMHFIEQIHQYWRPYIEIIF